jgi:hypothetical protein
MNKQRKSDSLDEGSSLKTQRCMQVLSVFLGRMKVLTPEEDWERYLIVQCRNDAWIGQNKDRTSCRHELSPDLRCSPETGPEVLAWTEGS